MYWRKLDKPDPKKMFYVQGWTSCCGGWSRSERGGPSPSPSDSRSQQDGPSPRHSPRHSESRSQQDAPRVNV